MCCGRVLQSGDRSWFRRSISSLVICLEEQSRESQNRSLDIPRKTESVSRTRDRFIPHDFLRRVAYSLGGVKKFFPPVRILRLAVLPTEVLGDLLRGELSLAHVAKVSSQVNSFS